ncbi:DUF4406 domain-containing protein [uncultured Dysosmobacter sp.]|uniref:DUF7768 domain-containing protein n=1 Tax=uncultured Dysosmobacter sp. TaxID=2591384 RepID=UPI0026077639|nr:DUF4406 domain-containing protein [uncultured Dysosmobacter sp.]
MSAYRNYEGYCDPTAGAAITKCRRKDKSDRRKAVCKANAEARKGRAIVYICSPYAGDTVRNILAAQKYCRYAVDSGYIPFAAHLFFPQFLSDEDPTERSQGLSFGNVFMDKCSEVWIFGTEYSPGMKAEYERAVKKGFRVRHFTTDCREITVAGNGGNQDGRI